VATTCTQLDQILPVKPSALGCEECLKIGSNWVHLRECLICGRIGCCDSSPLKHATKQFHATDHPIAQAKELSEDWLWCYVDELYIGPEEVRRPRSRV